MKLTKRNIIKIIHNTLSIFFIILLVSGLSLYISPLRTFFNKLGFPLVAFHFYFGLIYIAIIIYILKNARRYLRKRAPLNKFNLYLIISTSVLLFVTGLIMHFQHFFPTLIKNYSVVIHDYLTGGILLWTIIHFVGHSINYRFPWPDWWRGRKTPPNWVLENKITRRDFVKNIFVFFLFLMVGRYLKWLSPILNINDYEKQRSGYFRIYNVTNDYPDFEKQDWQLSITDLNGDDTSVNLIDMKQFKHESIINNFHCVTGWSVNNVKFTGIYLKDVLNKYAPSYKNAKFINAYSGDEVYYESYTLDQIVNENLMLIFEIDDLPLKKSQGYPCRLYNPKMYGYKSLKWLTKIEFSNDRKYGYWQTNGDYDLNGYI